LACHGEGPTAERLTPVAGNEQLVATGGSQMLLASNLTVSAWHCLHQIRSSRS